MSCLSASFSMGSKFSKIVIYLSVFTFVLFLVGYFNKNISPVVHCESCRLLYSSSVPLTISDTETNISALNSALQKVFWSAGEMQEFIYNQLSVIKKRNKTQDIKESLEKLDLLSSDFSNVLESQLNVVGDLVHLKFIRLELTKNLSQVIQARIENLQNPTHCDAEEPFYCCLTNPWGFTSQIHDLLSCSLKAYYTKKRFALVTDQWHYHKGIRWDTFFTATSATCPPPTSVPAEKCLKDPYGTPSRDILNQLPFDLASDMHFLGRNPLPWWYGQFIGRLMKPNHILNRFIESSKVRLGFKHPIVGVHVRRTDKVGTEAFNHSVNEYMYQVEKYFDKLESQSGKVFSDRRIFVATDDPDVHSEFIKGFPNYTVLYNPSGANFAKDLDTRYSDDSVWGILLDLYLLASSDHIVCTFSSGMGRLAFELMQFLQADHLNSANSLDVPYHYVFSVPLANRAIFPHRAKHKGEISMIPGDVLVKDSEKSYRFDTMQGKRSDGMLSGTNTRTRKFGYYPSFKTEPILNSRVYQAVDTHNLN